VPVELVLAEQRGALRVLALDSLRDFGVDALITTREGGVSEAPFDSLNLGVHVGDDPRRVATNRARLAEAMRVSPERLVTVSQVHGADVLEVEGPLQGEADALVTSSRDTAIAVLVADCLPIVLADASRRRVGVVHAGWRGLAAGVLANALARFDDVRSVHAIIGPGVSPRVYQVGPEVAENFLDVPGAVLADVADRSRLDLRAIALHQLAAAGVASEHVEVVPVVTDGGGVFFSDRASRPTGRFALVARVLA
jgi:polyphenol oxidase